MGIYKVSIPYKVKLSIGIGEKKEIKKDDTKLDNC